MVLHFGNRAELRQWLKENHNKEKCCWVVTYRRKCPEWPAIPYIEVVEEVLCFGWIDSTLKRLPDGLLAQRLSPRRARLQEINSLRESARLQQSIKMEADPLPYQPTAITVKTVVDSMGIYLTYKDRFKESVEIREIETIIEKEVNILYCGRSC